MRRASEGRESRLTHAMILTAPEIPPDCVDTMYASRPLSLTARESPPNNPGAAAATPPRPWYVVEPTSLPPLAAVRR